MPCNTKRQPQRERSLGDLIQKRVDDMNKRQRKSMEAMEAFKKRTGQQGQDVIRLF